VGIEQDLQSRIFEPFLQIELGKRTSEGLGIGLSLTQNLVQMHGGNIRAESSGKGRGSEFIVELPVYTREDHPNPSHDNTKKSDSPELNEGSYKVLVVDDNKAAAQGIGKLLGIKGYKVEYAHTGEEALDQALKWKPKSILLDIGLPDMDGYKVAKKLRADMKFKGGIIALTGYGQIEDRQRAYEAGCNSHLTKPIGISEVDHALKEIT
jgi:CheY-like chemotaxis protein